MALFSATLANKHHYIVLATVADSAATAKERFDAEALTPNILKCAEEERAMWLEEHGGYPGDEAYTYELIDNIEGDPALSWLTPEYRATIEANTAGAVFHVDSGANG